MKKGIDKQWIGVILGLFLPLLGVYIYYLIIGFHMPFSVFVMNVVQMHLTAKVLSLGVLANLAGFLIFFGMKKDRIARGIVLSTLIYAAVILVFRFFV